MELLSYEKYNKMLADTRDKRMQWWREARFGMFVHFGLYSVLKHNEWAMAGEAIPPEEYAHLAENFQPEEGSLRKWAKLAKDSGMKYMVLTTRHHEGFSLWNSKVNAFNSVNYGPKRDLVREFVDACHEYDLKVGFYSSLMDWHHPDGGKAAYDSAARKRFTDYIYELNKELLTQYGKIDILWYDVARPMEHREGWNSLEMNQRLRELQPDIIINNRSLIPEDFGTPEERINAEERDWESCMTFNGLSWGYVDSRQASPYSYTAPQIIRMLQKVTSGGGNLLLNVGPAPDGTLPYEAVNVLKTVGQWLRENGDATYGAVDRVGYRATRIADVSQKGKKLYAWCWLWPEDGKMVLAGFDAKVKFVKLLSDGRELAFEQKGGRIIIQNLPRACPDKTAGISVIEVEFLQEIKHTNYYNTPALNKGDTFKINQ